MSEQEKAPAADVDVPLNDGADTAAEPTAATDGHDGERAALEAELAQVRKALAEADVRAQAEIQNMRRRVERDVANAHKFALEKFAGELISVADTLERGLSALDADNEALSVAREGTELTLKQLLDVFGRFQIVQIDPQGEQFNPEQHEAMAMVPVPGKAANAVVEVLEKGYSLSGRLIRPARVVVAKGE
ncbi:nucleotide exchange factor GrpE [Isoalcanivorax beigongshangi]|uniref:Protein GrpE n=1 Tax=Isoalcanivorax beigongshangi TaxID=3238810 RepID=A0ABV4ADF1_9GAMM